MIDIENLDDEQKSILQTFAKNVDDCTAMERADHELLKWLVARNFDLKEAEKMFRLSYTWRQANQVDDILKWTPPEVFEKYYSMGSSGYDKHGCAGNFPVFSQLEIGIDSCRHHLRITNFSSLPFIHCHYSGLKVKQLKSQEEDYFPEKIQCCLHFSLDLRLRSNGYERDYEIRFQKGLLAFRHLLCGEDQNYAYQTRWC